MAAIIQRGSKVAHRLSQIAPAYPAYGPHSRATLYELPPLPSFASFPSSLSLGNDIAGLVPEEEDDSSVEESEYLYGFQLWVSMVSLMLCIFLIAMDLVWTLSSLSSSPGRLHSGPLTSFIIGG